MGGMRKFRDQNIFGTKEASRFLSPDSTFLLNFRFVYLTCLLVPNQHLKLNMSQTGPSMFPPKLSLPEFILTQDMPGAQAKKI